MDGRSEAGRADERFKASLPARLLHDGREYPCAAQDLSRSGVLLIGDLPAPETPDVEVVITTTGGDLELRVTGSLVHVQEETGGSGKKLGLQFQELSAGQKETVEAMVYRVMEGMAPAAIEALPKNASAGEIRQALSSIPLPHRVMLAHRGQVREREILRHDGNPDVLEALVRNPKILLPEILALARLRHLSPSTVKLLAEDRRWAGSEELKILLATHPRVTFSTAEKIISSLNENALQRIIRRPGLHQGVRQKLMAKLARRPGQR